ncbi:sugar transferase [Epibacterium ulvae]|uniref:sugar transferase n=1 Tax=Epibacterium ulvae TaxID=1156985 RepID=UPI003EBB0A96
MDDLLARDKGLPFVGQQTNAVSLQGAAGCADAPSQTATMPKAASGFYGGLLRRGAYGRLGKRGLDLLLVVAALPLVVPIIALCAVALWVESGLPFYRQKRLGRNGRVFSILKLRTMVRQADTMLAYYLDADPALRAEWDATQKLKNDPRITPVGRFLRVTSLDELPQIWNVLTGDMSLVGPRPMLPDQLEMYGSSDAYFTMRPGITGKWQVSARNESGFAARQLLDREYVSFVSLREDLQIMRRTVGVVLRGTGY